MEKEYSQIGNMRKGTIKNAYTYASGKNGEFFSTCIKDLPNLLQKYRIIAASAHGSCSGGARLRLIRLTPRDWPPRN